MAAGTAVRRLATDLGLRFDAATVDGSVRLEPLHGQGILLFPGTRVANVAGTPYETTEPIEVRAGEIWVSPQDARAMQVLFRAEASVSVPPRSAGPPRRAVPLALPPPPRPIPKWPAASRAPVRSAATSQRATAAQRAEWGVRLKRRWKWIVVHHSGGESGNAAAFHRHHLNRGWDGLGYHFVIGNGKGSPDGLVEVGYRWKRQQRGAHAGQDAMNEHGIGICLVGNFDQAPPTRRQMQSLELLSRFLGAHCDIASWNVRQHRDVRKTACPGKHFPRDWTYGAGPIRTASR